MKALVLVGGLGTRLRPITYSIPKQLIPVAGQPLLYHVLDLLPPSTSEIILSSGYKSDVLQSYLNRHPPRWPVRVVAEPTPLGTGGGMRFAGNSVSDPFWLFNSDVITQIEMSELERFHRQRNAIGTMALARVEDTQPYGVAALGPQDRIDRFVEKPAPAESPSSWINAGISLWRREVIERIPTGQPVSWERDVLPHLLTHGVYAYRLQGYWEDAGTPERILHAQRLLFGSGRGSATPLPSGCRGTGPVFVAPGVESPQVHFGGNVTLADGVTIGTGASFTDCIVMEGATIGSHAVIDRSIIGPGTHVEVSSTVRGQVVGKVPDT